jgi:hypothetical protein
MRNSGGESQTRAHERFPLKYAAEGAPQLYRSVHKVTKTSSPHGVKCEGFRAFKDTGEALLTCILREEGGKDGDERGEVGGYQ